MTNDDSNRIARCFPRSTVWDKETQQAVDGVRAYIHRRPQPTISKLQEDSRKARTPKESSHYCEDTFQSPPEDEARQAFFKAVDSLGQIKYKRPPMANVPVEWVFEGNSVTRNHASVVAKIGSTDWDSLSKRSSSDGTIFHLHGGGLFQGSPGAYRATTSTLARLSKARVVSVDYRLCPQNPFPCGLLDVFIAYLSLLYPPSEASHSALDPSEIVLAGDSSGGALACALFLVLQELSSHPPISFHDHTIRFPLPSPAGIAVTSLAGELLQSMPSHERNRVNDLFLDLPWSYPDYPACGIWPTQPPRPDLVESNIEDFTHPLVSICMAPSWTGAPPMWFGCGEEQFLDGAKAVARKAAEQGVSVSWLVFEAMPHCFFTLPVLSQSKHASLLMERWATFCRQCIERPGQVKVSGASATEIGFRELKERTISLHDLDDPSDEELHHLIKAKIARVRREFERDWTGSTKPKL